MVMPPTCSGEDLGARGAVWVGTHFPKRIATAGAFGSTLSQRHGLFLVVVGVTGVAVATVIVFAEVVCGGGVRWWCAVVVCDGGVRWWCAVLPLVLAIMCVLLFCCRPICCVPMFSSCAKNRSPCCCRGENDSKYLKSFCSGDEGAEQVF